MPSCYLSSDDYAAFGVPMATASQVTLASAFIDAYLGRPEGLVWAPDATGRPAYMLALNPTFTLTAGAFIAPGVAVDVPVTGGQVAQVGDIVILDRTDPTLCEACRVSKVAPGVVTLASVQFAHNTRAQIEFGLTISEERSMPPDRPVTSVSRAPVVALLGGQGRYGYGRRGAQNRSAPNDFNLLASVATFGGPPQWQVFSVVDADVNPQTGQVWIPTGFMLAYYSDVRLHYIAGFSYASLPYEVKQACANIIQAKGNNTALDGNIQTLTMGTTKITRFSNTLMDDDTKRMLLPFRARMFG